MSDPETREKRAMKFKARNKHAKFVNENLRPRVEIPKKKKYERLKGRDLERYLKQEEGIGEDDFNNGESFEI